MTDKPTTKGKPPLPKKTLEPLQPSDSRSSHTKSSLTGSERNLTGSHESLKETKQVTMSKMLMSRWDMIREKVKQGFFRNMSNTSQAPKEDLMQDVIERVWNKVHEAAGCVVTSFTKDSTDDFIEQPWVHKKTGRAPSQALILSRGLARASFVGQTKSKRLPNTLSAIEESGSQKPKKKSGLTPMQQHLFATKPTTNIMIDRVPQLNLNAYMLKFGDWIVKSRSVSDDSHFESTQLTLNRCWKIFLLGLYQAEPISRYITLSAINRAVHVLPQTLVDPSTGKGLILALVDVSVGDERIENQAKANFLLAELAVALKDVREYQTTLLKAFKQLSKSLLERQYAQKDSKSIFSDNMPTIVERFHAIGKFASLKPKEVVSPTFVHDTIMYLAHEELELIDQYMTPQDRKEFGIPRTHLHLIVVILDILNGSVPVNDANKKYVGAMFRKYVFPWMQSGFKELQKAAVQFSSSWLPIEHDQATIYAIDQLLIGLAQTKLAGADSFKMSRYQEEYQKLCNRKYQEQCDVALRMKLSKQLTQAPGTMASLLPVPGCPGFFCDADSNLRYTKSLLVDLPVHPDSNVTITRVIPSIPGVPKGFTTCPPVYFSPDNVHQLGEPQSLYQLNELIGKTPGLPPGYTYAPNPLQSGKSIQYDKEDKKIVVGTPFNTFALMDKIPDEMTNRPWSQPSGEDGKPHGLSTVCPYNGFDPSLNDRSSHPSSAIYEKNMFSNTDSGFTSQPFPVLFPSKTGHLKPVSPTTDFPLHSTVVLDVIEPQSHRLKRIKAIVRSHDVPPSDVIIQQDAQASDELLHIGYTFSIYLRTRLDEKRWSSAQLEIVDDEYDDGINLMAPRTNALTKASKVKRNMHETFPYPIPAEFSSAGEPLFAPPVSLPPLPYAYTPNGTPLYAQTANIKPVPTGITNQGERFYASKQQTTHKHMLAGYDNNGQPFFLPKGFASIPPSGFTVDGIPFYDVFSMVFSPGQLVTPHLFKVPGLEDDDDNWEHLLYRMHYHKESTKHQKRLQKLFLGRLGKSLKSSQPKVMNALFGAGQRPIGSFRPKSMAGEWTPTQLRNVQDPENIQSFMRLGLESRAQKFEGFRVMMEPASYEFYSFKASQNKMIALRFKAPRGDREHREVFLATHPREVFTVSERYMRLSGEGVQQINVSFSPIKMDADLITGGLHVIDSTGTRIASCQLVARRQGFFSISTNSINAGWVMPERKKTLTLKITNHSANAVTLGLALKSDEPSASEKDLRKPTEAPFKLKQRTLRVLPFEVKPMTISFEPKIPGSYTDAVSIIGSGGDIVTCQLFGNAGIPVAIFPEDPSANEIGISALTKERTAFLSKHRKLTGNEVTFPNFSNEEIRIIKNISGAQSDSKSRKDAHTLDFGVLSPSIRDTDRIVTFLNLGGEPLTLSLYSHDPAIKCLYLIRVQPYSANALNVKLIVNTTSEKLRGNFVSLIEVACPDFENLPLHVTAYIGQPIFFPVWESVFFKPCKIGEQQKLILSLCNESHYDVAVNAVHDDEHTITNTIPQENQVPLIVPPFGLVPITFNFAPPESGVYRKSVTLIVSKPFQAMIPLGMMGRQMQLFGICIDPNRNPKKMVDLITRWMANTAGLRDPLLIPEDAHEVTECDPQASFDVEFKVDPFISENNAFSMATESTSSALVIQNRGNISKDVTIVGSSCFTINPPKRTLQPGELVKLEHYFSPPFDILKTVTVYGFAMAIDDQNGLITSAQIIKKMSSGLLVLPYIGGEEKQIMIDFGNLELAGDIKVDCVKYLMLCNPHTSPFRWTLKQQGQKSDAFEWSIITGDVSSYETFTIPFRFNTGVSGQYESTCEIHVSEPGDPSSKAIAKVQVVLRGNAVYTSLTGVPESIEFSNALVHSVQKRAITINNTGTAELSIKAFAKPPFSISPGTATLPAKNSMKMEVSFEPTQNTLCTSKIQIFANQTLHLIEVSGCGGMSALECEKYGQKPLDFGVCKESTISWISVYVTNAGTLPCILSGISSTHPKLIKLLYIDTVGNVPLEIYQQKDTQLIEKRNDHWNILRRKLKVFQYFRPFFEGASRHLHHEEPTEAKSVIKGNLMTVQNHEQLQLSKTGIKDIPILQPHCSYHFKVGYVGISKGAHETDIIFSYIPQIDETEGVDPCVDFLQSTTLDITGTIVRPLEILPKSIDFGPQPAERFLAPDKKQEEDIDKNTILVLNMSKQTQHLALEHIDEPFYVKERFWTISAGDQITIPVHFHPQLEQLMYRGAAVFKHNFGKDSVQFSGIGATAELTAPQNLNFGRLKIGSKLKISFDIQNCGVLHCPYEMDIQQNVPTFRLLGTEDPFEKSGVLESGKILTLEIECDCRFRQSTVATIEILWRKIPLGQQQRTVIPLLVESGFPQFQVSQIELDFKTTYIDVNKTLPLVVSNSGNATCNWSMVCENPQISGTVTSGVIGPGEKILTEITYAPTHYESHSSVINFTTDSGSMTVLCSGVVGVPYLKLQKEMLQCDFGIATIERPHNKSFEMYNTGSHVIEFEIVWSKVLLGSTVLPLDEFDVFAIHPSHGSIPPGIAMTVTLSILPKEYDILYSGHFLVRTKDGEQYKGLATATGGMAIIKIKPPTMATKRSQALNLKDMPSQQSLTGSQATIPVDQSETSRYIMQAHMDNLYDVLAGVRSAESRMLDSGSSSSSRSLPSPQTQQAQFEASPEPTKRRQSKFSITPLMTPPKKSGPEDMIPESPMVESPVQKLDMLKPGEPQRDPKSPGRESKSQARESKSQQRESKTEARESKTVIRDSKEQAAEPAVDGKPKEKAKFSIRKASQQPGQTQDQQPEDNEDESDQEPKVLDKIFDGSDLKLRSRTTTPSDPDNSRPESTSSIDLQSNKFIEELVKLEKELEVAIGIRDVTSPLISKTPTPQSREEESEIKYNPGRRKGRKKPSSSEMDKMQQQQLQQLLQATVPTIGGRRESKMTSEIQSKLTKEEFILDEEPKVEKGERSLLKKPSRRSTIGSSLPPQLQHMQPPVMEDSDQERSDHTAPGTADTSKPGTADYKPLSEFPKPMTAEMKPSTAEIKSMEEDLHPKPPTYPAKEGQSISRASTPMLATQRPFSRKEEQLASALAAKGLIVSPENAALAAAEMRSSRTVIENILSMARDISKAVGVPLDPRARHELLQVLNDRVLESTKVILKSVKTHMNHESWIPNREFLQQAIKRLQMSTLALGTMLQPEKELEKLDANTFDLGIIKGGDVTPLILLFSIPNEGNIPFEYSIHRDPELYSRPPNCEPLLSGDYFVIEPMEDGILNPGQSLDISGSFQALTSGMYRQKYIVRSGGEDILSFTLQGQIGNPDLRVMPNSIDFGLIERGKTETKAMVITNVGTYKDQWRIEFQIDGMEPEDSPFKFQTMEGETLAKENTAVPIKFEPKVEGEFRGKAKLLWTHDPIVVDIVGLGGGAKLQFAFTEQQDKSLNGLDFGTCIVGMQYKKTVKFKNIGTVDGLIEMQHPNPCITFQTPRNSSGEFRLGSNKEVDITIFFNPTRSELIREPVIVDLGNSGQQQFAFRAKCGVQEWTCAGQLDFLNMKVEESQSKIVSVTNSGTLDIPFEISVEPHIAKFISFSPMDETWVKGRSLRPNQSLSFEIMAFADSPQMIDGNVVFKTVLGGQPTEHLFPIKFRIYVQEVAIDNSQDVGVGRVLIGESVTKEWSIDNFGNRKVKYRARIENMEGIVDIDGAWKLVSAAEGEIEINDNVKIEAMFQSLHGKGDSWQEAVLVVEKLNEDGTWALLSSLKLQGAAGEPKFDLEPLDIDFGLLGLNEEATGTFWIRNDGNAMLKYQMNPQWESPETFFLYPDTPMQSIVDPESRKPVQILFKTGSPGRYATQFKVITALGEKGVNMYVEAAPYQIFTDALPPVLDFGLISVGDQKSVELVIENDCPHTFELQCRVYENDPRTEAPELLVPSSLVICQPSAFTIKGVEDERTNYTLQLQTMSNLELVDGLVSQEYINQLVIGQLQRLFVHVYSPKGISEVIPLEVTQTIQSVGLTDGKDEIQELVFGELTADVGGKRKIKLHNPNGFEIRFQAQSKTPQFKLSRQFGILLPNGSFELDVELLGIDITGDVSIPKVQKLETEIQIKFHLQQIPEILVPAYGYLVDTVPKLLVVESLDFGQVFTNRTMRQEFRISNPSRRRMPAKFRIDKRYSDVFKQDGAVPAVVQPKTLVSIDITFAPQGPLQYSAQAFLETEAGNTVISLTGEGVEPKVSISSYKIDFGAVGIGHEEFRELTVTNESKLGFHVRLKSENPKFRANPTELFLLPGDPNVFKIEFHPEDEQDRETSKFIICMLEDGEEVGEYELYSTKEEIQLLQQFETEAKAGTFELLANGMVMSSSVEQKEPETIQSKKSLGNVEVESKRTVKNIEIQFPKISLRTKAKKTFTVENSGTVPIELHIMDVDGRQLDMGDGIVSKKKHFKWMATPMTLEIPAGSSDIVTIQIEALTSGPDQFEFLVSTRRLVNQVTFHVQVDAEVADALGESLKAFVRADTNFETMISTNQLEEQMVATDSNLWKLMLPVVRISNKLPSEELQTVSWLEPNCSRPDITPLLVRPPALPVTLPPRAKKWYMNRVSMGLERVSGQQEIEDVVQTAKREEALSLVQPVERALYLEKKRPT
ncbi:hypothetical protein EDD86DRAFT_270613 [Gorgonomyces haynaldii]|nr:hypothetical protein EDD86DRAFT_270613 [Gorgonomyces haynaldii]